MKIFPTKKGIRMICLIVLGILWSEALLNYIDGIQSSTLLIATMIMIAFIYQEN